MFIVDILIIIFLALGFLIGFKRGMVREIVSLVGLIIITILAFILKNPISVLLYKTFPFFNFDYIIKGASVLNVLLYEIIAFLVVFIILFIILKILLKISKLLDRILKMTIILNLPSRIIGGIVGVVKNYLITFVVLFIISLPAFSIDIGETKIGDFILNETPILTDINHKTIKVYDEFEKLVEDYKNKDNKEEFNQEALDLLIKYKTITKDNAKDLIESGKLKGLKVK